MVGTVLHIGTTPLTQLMEEWYNQNNAAYNQLLLCIEPDLQTAVNNIDIAADAWITLTNKFKSKDPSKTSIARTKYEDYHMIEGQSVNAYLTTMKEF